MTLYYSLHETQRRFGTNMVRIWFNDALDIMPDDSRLDMVGWINQYFRLRLKNYEERDAQQGILPFAKKGEVPDRVISDVRA